MQAPIFFIVSRSVLQSTGGVYRSEFVMPMWALTPTATPADLPPFAPLPQALMDTDQPFALIVASVSLSSASATFAS